MHFSVEFVLKRMLATENFQALVAAIWVWAKKTVAQWGVDRAALAAKGEDLVGFERRVKTDREEMQNDLNALHADTSQALGMMRGYYRNDPVKLSQLEGLSASAHHPADILAEALALESQWKLLPEADRDIVCLFTLEAFTTKRVATIATVEAFTALLTEERQCRTEFNDMLGHAWQDCVAWYETALVVFSEDTPEGVNLRATIPTDLPQAAADASGDPGNPGIPGDGAPSGVTA